METLTKQIKQARAKADWLARRIGGARAEALLAPLPVGAEFRLVAGPTYSATYRKNAEGLWDQVADAYSPLVRNMSADHLGFCVGVASIRTGLEAAGHLEAGS